MLSRHEEIELEYRNCRNIKKYASIFAGCIQEYNGLNNKETIDCRIKDYEDAVYDLEIQFMDMFLWSLTAIRELETISIQKSTDKRYCG